MSRRTAKRRKVLLVGWDAADWKIINPLMDAGKMPTLQGLVERGVMGNLSTLHPVLSPMLWTSIATGKRPFKHGILGFTEPTPDVSTIRPVSSLSRTTKAFWNILHQNGLKSNVIAWWPSHPAEPIDGVMVSNHFQQIIGPLDKPWPLPSKAVHPKELSETISELRYHPQEIATDQILAFIPNARDVDQESDPRLASAMKILAECTSVHAAATWTMQHTEWDLTAVYYDAIDHFCHGFMKYHPPRRNFIPERDYELYKGVVEAAYCYHDMMLGGLLQQAGEGCTVILCSDHGFHPDHNRPVEVPTQPAGPAIEHRDFGVFLIAGPGIHKDEIIHGASLLDVAPTLLTLFDLPVGEDMDGKPLLQVFESPPQAQTIPSWDAVEGDAGQHDSNERTDPIAANEAIRQLIALGYVDEPDEDIARAVTNTTRELSYNLALSYMDAYLHADAIPVLQELRRDHPDDHRFGIQLALCYQATNHITELKVLAEQLLKTRLEVADKAREGLRRLKEKHEAKHDDQKLKAANWMAQLDEQQQVEVKKLREQANIPIYDVQYLRGYVALAEGDSESALQHLQKAEQALATRPGLHIQIGEAYLRIKRWEDAERAFTTALRIEPENPHAHLGIARCCLARRQARRAVDYSIATISFIYNYPMAHFCLGCALTQLKRFKEAEQALLVAITLNPNFKEAHRRLAVLYGRQLYDPSKADEHRKLAHTIARHLKTVTRRSSQGLTSHHKPDFHIAHLSHKPATIDVDKPVVTVVTGLPRSGTSMMMQMLSSGGMPILSDGKRVADEDNPRGYYELEAATRLSKENLWISNSVGKAVKIVAPLLTKLPRNYRYRVIFMQRDLNEVIASQRTMLERLNSNKPEASGDMLNKAFQLQLRQINHWLGNQNNIETLHLHYHEVIMDPETTARSINDFLGGGFSIKRMCDAVDPSLHRQQIN